MFACSVLFQCQNHIDCCSRNCLTFSYKCIRSRSAMPQMGQATLPQLQPVAVGGVLPVQSVNSIDELVNRFGNDEDESRPASTTTTTPTAFTMSNSVYHSSTASSLQKVTNQNNSSNTNIYSGIQTPSVCLSTGLRVGFRSIYWIYFEHLCYNCKCSFSALRVMNAVRWAVPLILIDAY